MLDSGQYFYYVHSYVVPAVNSGDSRNQQVWSVEHRYASRQLHHAVQFHPEKSGARLPTLSFLSMIAYD